MNTHYHIFTPSLLSCFNPLGGAQTRSQSTASLEFKRRLALISHRYTTLSTRAPSLLHPPWTATCSSSSSCHPSRPPRHHHPAAGSPCYSSSAPPECSSCRS